MASTNAPTLDIVEVLEQIVAFLYDDPPTLRACALTSRLLVAAAQLHLFYTINFDLVSPQAASPLHIQTTLAQNPRLAQHIRRIHFLIDDSAQIAKIPLPRLEHITLRLGIQSDDPAPVTAAIIGLPSVRSVEVCGVVRGPGALALIFSACTPNLQEVAFRRCSESYLRHGLPREIRQSVRTQLTRLVLFRTVTIPPLLLDGGCPFDLSRLVSVDAHLTAFGVKNLLEHTRLSISMENIEYVDLTCFPALTHLELECAINQLLDLPVALEHVDPGNAIREIILVDKSTHMRRWTIGVQSALQNDMKEILPAFDAALAVLPLHALQRVELSTRRYTDVKGDLGSVVRETEALWKKCLPILVARKLLVLTTY
ncbi:hypothetical protein C8F04DRAFT_1108094 [Mycena alexandri]|uniref:Uncharacterized protein n=1 Tax=Mycena alexandri TaxID=1745969 RepID=A0AAD6X4T4_9AGAR|nr:hypothetical protein C8F04DRAFT_1108094 [Mycena alexandri]